MSKQKRRRPGKTNKRRTRSVEHIRTSIGESIKEEVVSTEDVEQEESRAASSTSPGGVPLWRAILSEPIALGIAVVIFFRPWRDGLTYPAFNAYYLWVIILLTAFWGARLLLRGETIRFRTPIFLFALYLFVALVTSFSTIQVDATYRSMLFWCGHFFLFLLCTNGLRTRLAIGIVLGSFIVSSFANAIWSIIHFNYMLPLMREAVDQNPSLLLQYFGVSELTPEIRHRLEVNRAFGTLLFPNALAAFMILGIPYLLGELWPTWRSWRSVWTGGSPSGALSQRGNGREFAAVLAGALSWLLSAAAAWFLFTFLLLVTTGSGDWSRNPVQSALYVGVIPLLIGAGSFYATLQRGLMGLRLTLQIFVIPAALAAQLITLVLTYSRGGILGVAAALALAAMLVIAGSPGIRGRFPRKTVVAAASVLLICLVSAFAIETVAQTEPATAVAGAGEPAASDGPRASRQNVNIDGINLNASDMVDLASFSLRVSYWKVGWAMAKDNLLTGVGLGNFGTSYAKYQFKGAGDVKAAHNAYLSALCETGIFGFLAFCALWGYFAVWGAKRVYSESRLNNRLILAGLYAGVLAFLIHSIVDFNFYNPALVSILVFLAGVFFARSASFGTANERQAEPKRFSSQVSGLVVLVLVAFATGAAWGVYRYDFSQSEGTFVQRLIRVGNKTTMRHRANVAQMLLRDLNELPSAGGRALSRPLGDVHLVIPDSETLNAIGTFRVPQNGNPPSYRRLAQGEAPPPNTLIFIHDIERARREVADWSEKWLRFIDGTNDYYPYSPRDAEVAYQWYMVLQDQETDPEKKKRLILECVKWGRIGVERSPEQAWFHERLANALFLKGNIQGFPAGEALYAEGLSEFRKARDLYSIQSHYWRQLGNARKKVSDAYFQVADSGPAYERFRVKGQELLAQSEAALAKAAEMDASPS